VDDVRWLDYQQIQKDALEWRKQHNLKARATDRVRIGALGIDIQDTFCNPNAVKELFVAGHSGRAAVDDSIRFVEFIYRYLGILTDIDCTMDTHRWYAVFHPSFLVDEQGNHPSAFASITHKEVADGKWRPSPFMASALGITLMQAQKHLLHYTQELEKAGRYALTVWPYHAQLGDKGHNLVAGLSEATKFHAHARGAQNGLEVKGLNPLVENYSVLGPEVKQLYDGTPVARNANFVKKLMDYDVLVIAGQAKSHCVAWTIDDLLGDILAKDPQLARKVYILEDCTTAIVAKLADGTVIYDYGPDADAAFDKFRNAGMHVVKSTDPIQDWPDIRL
jgi:nicotinamidase-related amidase